MVNGVYRHDIRKVIYLGDFIDRGLYQRETLDIVRPMIDTGSALSVMGNHEFNAIAYATFDKEQDDYLRRHTSRNNLQHESFLKAYSDNHDDYKEVIEWFKTLPLWLDLKDIRVVHACWDRGAMERLRSSLDDGNRLTDRAIKTSSTYGSQEFRDVETILKGKEVPLAQGHTFKDNDGNEWPNIRIMWWDQKAVTYQSAFMGNPNAISHIPDDKIEGDHLIEYSHHMPPVFLGHYWMDGLPSPLADNIACVDYSVAKKGGNLVAYRWDGEVILKAEKFVSIIRVES